MIVRKDTITNKSGFFKISSVDEGRYFIEAVHPDEDISILFTFTMDSAGTGVDLGPKELEQSAVISGIVSVPAAGDPAYVQVYGLERLAEIDPNSGRFSISVPAGSYDLRVVSTAQHVPPLEVSDIAVNPGDARELDTVYLEDTSYVEPYLTWDYAAKITLNTTSAGAAVSEHVLNVPLLVRLDGLSPLSSPVFDVAGQDGSALRFSKSDYTPLPYEIEEWNPAGEMAVIWVKLDTVYGNRDDQFIYLYVDGKPLPPELTDRFVFDTADGFTAVWHLNETAPAELLDRTPNENHGTFSDSMTATNSADAVAGKGLVLGSLDHYVTFSDMNSLPATMLTVSAWIRIDEHRNWNDIVYKDFWAVDQGTWDLFADSAGSLCFGVFDTVQNTARHSGLSTGEWYHAVGVYDGNEVRVYVNGVEGTERGSVSVDLITTKDLFLGSRNYFSGTVDEVRISRSVRSEAWIRLSYENQRPDQTLVSIGDLP
jgi:hypothetical protein